MNTSFKVGTIVKSKERTQKKPLFVMVLWEQETSLSRFKGVVLYNGDVNDSPDIDDDVYFIIPQGMVSDGWHTSMFEETDWIEFCNFMTDKLQL